MNMLGVLVGCALLAGCGAEGAAGKRWQLEAALKKEFPKLVESSVVKAVEAEVDRRLPELQKQFGFVSRQFVRAVLKEEGFPAMVQMDTEIQEYTRKATAYMAHAQEEMDKSIDRLLSQPLVEDEELLGGASTRSESDSDERAPLLGRGTCGKAVIPAGSTAFVAVLKQRKGQKPENRL